MKQKYIGLMTMLAGMLGMAGALDTGCGWCTSGRAASGWHGPDRDALRREEENA